jgi:hypothetical protein
LCSPSPYNMRHANSDALSFVTTTIGQAAGLSVSDTRTRFQKFVPFQGLTDEEDGEPHRVTTISSQLLLDALQGDDVAISELKATLAEPHRWNGPRRAKGRPYRRWRRLSLYT